MRTINLLPQAYDKGASKGVIGFIYGAPPLVVVILSPLLGYMVSAWLSPRLHHSYNYTVKGFAESLVESQIAP